MSRYLSGSKRLAVIQRWINGHDDPNWEVLPTKKEGKYIVKPRKTPISEDSGENSENDNIEESPINTESESDEEPPRKAPPTKTRKTQQYDPTVNEEILKQLKSLGEEMKIQREKKEQKRLINEAIDKRIRKPRKQQVQEDDELEEEPQLYYQPQTFSRRNRIFEDMM
ncbi:hypothetical protein [Helicobacter typhlonius]|uniref:hypothetical protein n=1 Tax=Helicobacter typhlonius TaxID=76936 RepID=UPI002FE24D48